MRLLVVALALFQRWAVSLPLGAPDSRSRVNLSGDSFADLGRSESDWDDGRFAYQL